MKGTYFFVKPKNVCITKAYIYNHAYKCISIKYVIVFEVLVKKYLKAIGREGI